MRTTERCRNQRGITLIDLTIAMAVAGIVTAISYGAVSRMIPRMQARQAVSDLVGAIRATRAQAILEQRPITMPIDVARARYTLVTRIAPGPVQIEMEAGKPKRIVRLPKGIGFVGPTGMTGVAPVTALPPGATEMAVAFNGRGRLLSQVLPGRIHIGAPKQGLYWRIGIDLAGGIKQERWNGKDWT